MSIRSLPVILVFAILLCIINVQAATIYVPDDYKSIQQAIDNANDGDTIIIRDGVYEENIKVSKNHLTIKSENGPDNCIVQAANPDDYVFEVTADHVNIYGFTVKGGDTGIYLNEADSCNISNSIVSNNYWNGFELGYSNNSILTNNIVSNNFYNIVLYSSNNNTLTNNVVSNSWEGIWLSSSNNNILTNNKVSNNDLGISLLDSNNNKIYLNNFINNEGNVVYSEDLTNIWNSTEKITYAYNGKNYTNYLGNYWSDYEGEDSDGDGIGETPYQIGLDKDYYPLIAPIKQFIVIYT